MWRIQSISSKQLSIFIFKKFWQNVEASSGFVKVYGKFAFNFKLKQKFILSVKFTEIWRRLNSGETVWALRKQRELLVGFFFVFLCLITSPLSKQTKILHTGARAKIANKSTWYFYLLIDQMINAITLFTGHFCIWAQKGRVHNWSWLMPYKARCSRWMEKHNELSATMTETTFFFLSVGPVQNN